MSTLRKISKFTAPSTPPQPRPRPPKSLTDTAAGHSNVKAADRRKTLSVFSSPPSVVSSAAEQPRTSTGAGGPPHVSPFGETVGCRRRFSSDDSPVPIPENTTANDLVFINTLSSSSLVDVVLVQRKDNKQIIAAKAFNHTSWRSEYLCHAELRVLQEVNSPWVVVFFGYIQDFSEDFLLLEYLPNGNLLELVHTHSLTECQLRFYAAEMFLAVDSLHQFGIMHRNIQLSNFMLHISGHLRIIGFGLSYQFRKDAEPSCSDLEKKTTFLSMRKDRPILSRITNPVYASPDKVIRVDSADKGINPQPIIESSTSYMAPEMLRLVMPKPYYVFHLIKKRMGYSYLCDYWSLGVAIYRMLYDHYPFKADSQGLIIDKVLNHRKCLTFPLSSTSLTGTALVKDVLKNENHRLGRYRGFDEVKNHIFFQDVNWDSLGHGKVTVPIENSEFSRYLTNGVSESTMLDMDNVTSLFQSEQPMMAPLFHTSTFASTKEDEDTTYLCTEDEYDVKDHFTNLDDAFRMVAAGNVDMGLPCPTVCLVDRGKSRASSCSTESIPGFQSLSTAGRSNEVKTMTFSQKLSTWFHSWSHSLSWRNNLGLVFKNSSTAVVQE